MRRIKAAFDLAESYASHPETSFVAFFSRAGGDKASDPIRVLFSTDWSLPLGIIPIFIGGDPFFACIDVSEEELEKVFEGSIELPEGWDVMIPIYRRTTSLK